MVGSASVPVIAWLVRDWFWIGIATTGPGVLLFLAVPFLPESPRWLSAVGRFDEAEHVLRNIAKVNGKSESAKSGEIKYLLQQFHEEHKRNEDSRKGFWYFFANWRLARNTIMLSIVW